MRPYIFTSEFYEDLRYEFNHWMRYSLNRTKRIHLAVVGIPTSGKSYMISDIIKSFECMGYSSSKLEIKGVPYQTNHKYLSDFFDKDGHGKKTDKYFCRQEDHFGAIWESNENNAFDIDYLNIPGETFGSQDKVDWYFEIRDKLSSKESNGMFYLTRWVKGNRIKYVVESSIPGGASNPKDKDDSGENKKVVKSHNECLSRKKLYKYLEDTLELKKDTSYLRKLSGKKLLKNLLKYDMDSVILSIGEKMPELRIDGLSDEEDFKTKMSLFFYFLYYCDHATDIIICDKILIPKSLVQKQENNNINELTFNGFIRPLQGFFDKGKGEHNIYMALRGVDFLFKGCENAYHNLRVNLEEQGKEDIETRNHIYSRFHHLLWHHIKPGFRMDNHFDTGYLDSDMSIEEQEKRYLNIDLEQNGGCTPDGSKLGALINTHIGQTATSNYRYLMDKAYPNLNKKTGNNTDIVPHAYFICTPITEDFIIYENDKEFGTRFVNDNLQGGARFFDQVDSHFCFGSFQLCLDILHQHELDNSYNATTELIAQLQQYQ